MPVVPIREVSTVTTEVNARAPTSPLGGLASGLESYSGSLGEVALDIQMRENADRVMRAEIGLRDAEREHRNSVRERKGVDAFGVTKESEFWWDEKMTEVGNTLENDMQREMFNDLAQQRRQTSLDTISGYEANERRNSFNESSAALIESAKNSAAEQPYNPVAIADERKRILETIGDLADSNGWTKAEIEAATSEQLTGMHAGVIDALMADSPPVAEAYFKEHRNEIAGKERATIDKMITERMIDHKAMALADKYYADEDSYDEANKKADKIKDPDLRKATRAAIRTQYADDVWGRQANEGLAAEEAFKVIAEPNGSLQDVKEQGIWNRLSGEDRLFLLRWQKQVDSNKVKDRTTDDLQMLTEVERKVEANMIRSYEDLNHYLPFFQETTRERLRQRMRENVTLDYTELRKAFEARIGQKRDVAGKNGWRAKHYEQWKRVQDYARSRVESGAQASDVGALIDELYLDGEMSDASFWRNDPDSMGEAIKKPGRAERFIFDVPEEHRAALQVVAEQLNREADVLYTQGGRDAISTLVNAGEPVNPANLLYVLNEMHGEPGKRFLPAEEPDAD